ncbi:Fic/DOC family protein [Alkalilimnicola sp. S0819]|uniref:Fic/DOC family protein n=1 Tax=Alkalilimnicola sp. S0819 TaxID=2613922 RepID=UPI0012614EAC|nr:Fic family protein [Alkalilimnicola sp. S0819]KAB7627602.1 cell filamentation protein Fic [Alkalilimnicola sp. S0819]MPQ15764.1 cell filamentation protein Fic [Alkalilimnicola sp. S0819]
MNRYSVPGSEGQFQPGSNEQVLANKLGLTDPAEMDEAELQLLLKLHEHVLQTVAPDQPLSVAMIKEWHRKWLVNIYPWAGEERSVNIAKGGFQFAAAAQVPRLLADLERQHLGPLTPCAGMSVEQAVHAIAVVHVELILIHPFRERNGRISRVLADVMAVQAGLGMLDFQPWKQNTEGYIGAIHAGLGGDYAPMEGLVSRAAGL